MIFFIFSAFLGLMGSRFTSILGLACYIDSGALGLAYYICLGALLARALHLIIMGVLGLACHAYSGARMLNLFWGSRVRSSGALGRM